MVLRAICLALALACARCASSALSSEVPNATLMGPHGEAVGARGLSERSELTVLVFFSHNCETLDAHDRRLISLASAFQPRGVQFYMVDSEARGSIARDAAEARKRGYSFPILLDRGGHLAESVGAEFATYSVVLDSSGRIRYRGGIDSDQVRLHDGATPYLANALDDLLSGRTPRVAQAKALGCALEKW